MRGILRTWISQGNLLNNWKFEIYIRNETKLASGQKGKLQNSRPNH